MSRHRPTWRRLPLFRFQVYLFRDYSLFCPFLYANKFLLRSICFATRVSFGSLLMPKEFIAWVIEDFGWKAQVIVLDGGYLYFTIKTQRALSSTKKKKIGSFAAL